MSKKEFHYRWEHDLRSSPQALWPIVADTNRFNRDAGVPAVVDTVSDDAVEPTLNSRRRLRLSVLGFNLEWEEDPFEWIRPYRFGVVRHYKSGPVSELRVAAEMTERAEGGTRLVYQIWATPRGPLGRLIIPLQIGRFAARKFAATFRRYDAAAASGEPAPPSHANDTRLNAGERARLELTRVKLIADGARPELVARLAETIERGDELTLTRIRPYALADCWNEPRRETLELCLRATRAGLLDFHWELLCPLCRGASSSAGSLKDVQSSLHCGSCNIDFTVNFDRSVELTFRPNAAVRRVEARYFCVGGPQVTPHIVAQQVIPPGERRTLMLRLEEGRHRLRAHNLPGGQFLSVKGDGADEASLRADGRAWDSEELHISPTPTLAIENATGAERLFILERTEWNDQAATAAEVTALQLFRDLFAGEALRPGDQINVGQMTILFTDLRGSTRLYREIGDAVAFGAVMSHFDVLKEHIADEGGSIVKTLGDAVMAAFSRPSHALRAIMRAQKQLASPPDGGRPLYLKAGIHSGPCIAVTLNGRLDYFGSHVNIAARLEPLSTGADCVISSAVREDPKVAAMLEDPGGFTVEPLNAQLKGFDDESFELWRVIRKD